MEYDYEYKIRAIKKYRQGEWPETPEGKNKRNFHKMVRKWVRMEEACGPEVLKHKNRSRNFTDEERYELVKKVLDGASINSVAFSAGIYDALLGKWVDKYKKLGYNGLKSYKEGNPQNNSNMKLNNKKKARKINETEYEELIRLRAENAYIKAENEVIKKEIALREEKQAALLKAKKQQLSKNSVKKDIN